MATYVLRDVPPEIWDRARARAQRQGWPLRPLLLQLLEDYGAGRIHPTAPPPGATAAAPSRAPDQKP